MLELLVYCFIPSTYVVCTNLISAHHSSMVLLIVLGLPLRGSQKLSVSYLKSKSKTFALIWSFYFLFLCCLVRFMFIVDPLVCHVLLLVFISRFLFCLSRSLSTSVLSVQWLLCFVLISVFSLTVIVLHNSCLCLGHQRKPLM